MKLIRFFGSIGAVVAVLWLAVSAGITSYVNKSTNGVIRVDSAANKLVYGPYGYYSVVYGRAPLAKKTPKIILIGPSNVRLGFIPHEMSPYLKNINGLKEIEIHNMGTGGTPKDYLEVTRLAYESMPKSTWSKTTFVVGLIYSDFIKQPEAIGYGWGGAAEALSDAATLYGIYRSDDDYYNIHQNWPNSLTNVFIYLAKPVLLFHNIWQHQLEFNKVIWNRYANLIKNIFTNGGVAKSSKSYKNTTVNAEYKKEEIEMFKSHGYARRKQFEDLVKLSKIITDHGSHFIIVDLPLPKWRTSAVPAFADYQKRKMKWFHLLQRKYNVAYINMQDGFADNVFKDHAHPKPAEAPVWSKILAKKLRPILASEKTSSVAAN